MGRLGVKVNLIVTCIEVAANSIKGSCEVEEDENADMARVSS